MKRQRESDEYDISAHRYRSAKRRKLINNDSLMDNYRQDNIINIGQDRLEDWVESGDQFKEEGIIVLKRLVQYCGMVDECFGEITKIMKSMTDYLENVGGGTVLFSQSKSHPNTQLQKTHKSINHQIIKMKQLYEDIVVIVEHFFTIAKKHEIPALPPQQQHVIIDHEKKKRLVEYLNNKEEEEEKDDDSNNDQQYNWYSGHNDRWRLIGADLLNLIEKRDALNAQLFTVREQIQRQQDDDYLILFLNECVLTFEGNCSWNDNNESPKHHLKNQINMLIKMTKKDELSEKIFQKTVFRDENIALWSTYPSKKANKKAKHHFRKDCKYGKKKYFSTMINDDDGDENSLMVLEYCFFKSRLQWWYGSMIKNHTKYTHLLYMTMDRLSQKSHNPHQVLGQFLYFSFPKLCTNQLMNNFQSNNFLKSQKMVDIVNKKNKKNGKRKNDYFLHCPDWIGNRKNCILMTSKGLKKKSNPYFIPTGQQQQPYKKKETVMTEFLQHLPLNDDLLLSSSSSSFEESFHFLNEPPPLQDASDAIIMEEEIIIQETSDGSFWKKSHFPLPFTGNVVNSDNSDQLFINNFQLMGSSSFNGEKICNFFDKNEVIDRQLNGYQRHTAGSNSMMMVNKFIRLDNMQMTNYYQFLATNNDADNAQGDHCQFYLDDSTGKLLIAKKINHWPQFALKRHWMLERIVTSIGYHPNWLHRIVGQLFCPINSRHDEHFRHYTTLNDDEQDGEEGTSIRWSFEFYDLFQCYPERGHLCDFPLNLSMILKQSMDDYFRIIDNLLDMVVDFTKSNLAIVNPFHFFLNIKIDYSLHLYLESLVDNAHEDNFFIQDWKQVHNTASEGMKKNGGTFDCTLDNLARYNIIHLLEILSLMFINHSPYNCIWDDRKQGGEIYQSIKQIRRQFCGQYHTEIIIWTLDCIEKNGITDIDSGGGDDHYYQNSHFRSLVNLKIWIRKHVFFTLQHGRQSNGRHFGELDFYHRTIDIWKLSGEQTSFDVKRIHHLLFQQCTNMNFIDPEHFFIKVPRNSNTIRTILNHMKSLKRITNITNNLQLPIATMVFKGELGIGIGVLCSVHTHFWTLVYERIDKKRPSNLFEKTSSGKVHLKPRRMDKFIPPGQFQLKRNLQSLVKMMIQTLCIVTKTHNCRAPIPFSSYFIKAILNPPSYNKKRKMSVQELKFYYLSMVDESDWIECYPNMYSYMETYMLDPNRMVEYHYIEEELLPVSPFLEINRRCIQIDELESYERAKALELFVEGRVQQLYDIGACMQKYLPNGIDWSKIDTIAFKMHFCKLKSLEINEFLSNIKFDYRRLLDDEGEILLSVRACGKKNIETIFFEFFQSLGEEELERVLLTWTGSKVLFSDKKMKIIFDNTDTTTPTGQIISRIKISTCQSELIIPSFIIESIIEKNGDEHDNYQGLKKWIKEFLKPELLSTTTQMYNME